WATLIRRRNTYIRLLARRSSASTRFRCWFAIRTYSYEANLSFLCSRQYSSIDLATPNDELIAGPSGAAYIFPSCWPAASLPQFLQRTGELMQSMGLTTLTALDTDFPYSTRLPLLSKISRIGMAFTHRARQQDF